MFGAAGAIFITLPSKKLGCTGSNLVFVGTLEIGMFLSNQLSNILCSLRSRLFFDNRYGFGAQDLLNTGPLMEGAIICLNIDFLHRKHTLLGKSKASKFLARKGNLSVCRRIPV